MMGAIIGMAIIIINTMATGTRISTMPQVLWFDIMLQVPDTIEGMMKGSIIDTDAILMPIIIMGATTTAVVRILIRSKVKRPRDSWPFF